MNTIVFLVIVCVRCVQRLRKRIAVEDQVVAVDRHIGFGRVPSFYTSRSIVNLSGLSVSDPLPSTTYEDLLTHTYQEAMKINDHYDDNGINVYIICILYT
jgi:hypothetical protein